MRELLYARYSAVFLLLIFAGATSIYSHKDHYLITVHGTASHLAVRRNSFALKSATCRQAADLSAKARIMGGKYPRDPGRTTIEGTRKAFIISTSKTVRGNQYKLLGCKSTRNNYEECSCRYRVIDHGLPNGWKKKIPAGKGFLDAHTAVGTVTAKLTKRQARYRPARRKSFCITAVRTNAFVNLVFDIAKKKKLKRKIQVRTGTPRIRTANCRSTRKKWSACSCRVMIYRKGLRKQLHRHVR